MTPNEAFRAWWLAQEAREAHEWRQWDGTEEQGIAIADAQTARVLETKAKLGADGMTV